MADEKYGYSTIHDLGWNDQTHSVFFVKHPVEGIVVFYSPIVCFTFYDDHIYYHIGRKEWGLSDFENYLNTLELRSFFHIQRKNQPLKDDYEVIHFFYEWNQHFLLRKEKSEDQNKNPLGIYIQYKKKFFLSKEEMLKKNYRHYVSRGEDISSKINILTDKEQYRQQVFQIREFFLKGDAYQVNLTSMFEYYGDHLKSVEDFYMTIIKNHHLWGAFFHTTYLDFEKKIYVSNSPENLFSIKKQPQGNFKIQTRPIKGTMPYGSIHEENKIWNQLRSSKKNHIELMMIVDLLRNDLSSIQYPRAKIIGQKRKLLVPGLIHQYMLLECQLDGDISLYKIMKRMHPGGSVTGAPKKRVLEIIQMIERERRGFYCGSTLLLTKNNITCSLNIRSGIFDLQRKILKGGSGGGLTLKSHWQNEYEEMTLKIHSFIKLFL